MQTQTVLLVVLAFIVSLGLALFQYKNGKTGLKLRILMASLRFLMFFGAFLLLINPEFVRNSYNIQKANLLVLIDGSSSISNNQDTTVIGQVLNRIQENEEVSDKYNLQTYIFDSGLRPLDSLTFTGNTTDITNSLKTIKETYTNTNNRVILVSDGNQTYGADYEFFSMGKRSRLDAVVVGDTTLYQDVGIGQVNSNRYGFLNNQFPLEAQLYYSGTSSVSTEVRIILEGKTVFRETLAFNQQKKSHRISTDLKAESVGIKTIRVQLSALPEEKNLNNNSKQLAIEIIDEKTVVGIISEIKHPDIGALKKAIESNTQREVLLLSPNASSDQLNNIDVFVVYQPTFSYGSIFKYLSESGRGSFIITGTHTDWNFLNDTTDNFSFESFGESEEILPVKNEAFDLFDVAKFETDIFPPLNGELGELRFRSRPRIVAKQQIRGTLLDTPMFFLFEEPNKQAYLLGENIWKWRSSAFRKNNNFITFDDFMSKLILYLSDSGNKERLRLDYENVYENASRAEIRASFYDKTFEFDRNAKLKLKVKGENGFQREIPMFLSGEHFGAGLGDFVAGSYTFTVTEESEKILRSGQFQILDFDLEKQYVSANDDKLLGLAERNSGQLFYLDKSNALVASLVSDQSFVPIQKSTKKVVSLIDFRIVLGIMALALALEWFLRKYNGLI